MDIHTSMSSTQYMHLSMYCLTTLWGYGGDLTYPNVKRLIVGKLSVQFSLTHAPVTKRGFDMASL